jgi:hypothetical protein
MIAEPPVGDCAIKCHAMLTVFGGCKRVGRTRLTSCGVPMRHGSPTLCRCATDECYKRRSPFIGVRRMAPVVDSAMAGRSIDRPLFVPVVLTRAVPHTT